MLKRLGIAALFLLVVLVAGLVVWVSSDSTTPRFNPTRSQPALGRVDGVHYDFLSPRPFEGGRMWVTARKGANEFPVFLYDLVHQSILGELHNAHPVFTTGDGSKVLCVSRQPQAAKPGLPRLAQQLDRLFHGKIPALPGRR